MLIPFHPEIAPEMRDDLHDGNIVPMLATHRARAQHLMEELGFGDVVPRFAGYRLGRLPRPHHVAGDDSFDWNALEPLGDELGLLQPPFPQQRTRILELPFPVELSLPMPDEIDGFHFLILSCLAKIALF